MENKDIINLLYETMKDRDVWFVTDIDYTFGKKDCYKLNEYGKLADEKEENKVVKEINSYIGDGAANVIEAIGIWLQNALYEDNSINFTDSLHMEFKDEPIMDGINASEVDLEKRGGPGLVRSVDITRGPNILQESLTDSSIYECMDCGEEFELSQVFITDSDGNPSCPYCGSGDVACMDCILEEDFTDEDNNYVIIETNLKDNASEEVLDSLIGQLSDGIWENSPAMEKYWRNMYIDRQDGQLVIMCKVGYGSGFNGKDNGQIRQWLANKIKQIVKQEELEWNRNNTEVSYYLDRGKGTKVTVQDAYRVYDRLLGRIDRIQQKTEGIQDPVIDTYTTGKWKVEIKGQPGKKPVAYFYDMSQDKEKFPEGQFTYSYYVETLLGEDGYGTPIDKMTVFRLDNDVPAWTIEGEDLTNIANWLKEFNNKEIKTESVKQDLIDANVEDLTTEGGEDYIVFYLGDKELASYSFYGTFDSELPATRQMLADENGVDIKDIKVKAITKPLTESIEEHNLSKDLFGDEATNRNIQRVKDFEKHLQYVKDIMAGKTVVDDKYNEELDLNTAKKWLRDDYVYIKGLLSLSPEEIDAKLAKDLPEIFSELDNSNKVEESISENEIIQLHNDIENAEDIDEIQLLIYSISDGVLEDEVQRAFDQCVTDGDSLDFIKDFVITTLEDNAEYEEDNEELSESKLLEEESKEDILDLDKEQEETQEQEEDVTEEDINEEETVDTSVTPEDKLRKRTQDVYNLLTDNGLDVAISTDNGENQVEVVLNDRDGKIIIPVREDNELQPITGGSISLDEDSLKILDQVKDILNSEEV